MISFSAKDECRWRTRAYHLPKGDRLFAYVAYGIPADLVDDHLAMGESQTIMCVKRFVTGIVQVFGPEYLTSPNAEDAVRLLEMNKARGFLGMLGSIDWMHWSWNNCPKA